MIVVVIALIVIFCNQPVEVNREIRHNTIHKREDIRFNVVNLRSYKPIEIY